MTKEEAKKKLRSVGYTVVDDNSVVTVLISGDASMKNSIKDVREKLLTWGYEASFAIRQHKGELSEIEDESDDEIDIAEEDAADDVALEDANALDEDMSGIASKAAASNIDMADKKNGNVAEMKELSEEDYFDEEDSDMLLNESSIQFSLEDFGLDF